MRRHLLGLLVGLTLLPPQPARAQAPQCGFGQALASLREAARELAQTETLESLVTGREIAARSIAELRSAQERLQGCGCPRAAEDTGDAATVTEAAPSAGELLRLRRILARAGFGVRQVEQRLGRTGCY